MRNDNSLRASTTTCSPGLSSRYTTLAPSAVAATQMGAVGRMSTVSLSGDSSLPAVPTGDGSAADTEAAATGEASAGFTTGVRRAVIATAISTRTANATLAQTCACSGTRITMVRGVRGLAA